MRRNMTDGQRMLSVLGGIAFVSLGMSDRIRSTFVGKALAIMGAKNAVVGLIGYNPLIKAAED